MLTVGLATAMIAALSTGGATAVAKETTNKRVTTTGPITRIVSPLADSSVTRGAGTPGAGSFDGSGFAFNVQVVTPKKATVPAAAGTRLTALMDGAQEISPTGSPAAGDPDGSGTFDAVVTRDGGTLCYRLRLAGIDSGTRFHIHRGAAGANGPIVVAFYETGEQPRDDCVRLDPALGAEIASAPGGFYVNVHNAAYPAGAVRGQLG